MVGPQRLSRVKQPGGWSQAPAANGRPTTVLDRLGPVLKAKVLLALVGLIVLGMGLIALVLLGGWAVRRQARRRTSESRADLDAGPAPPFPRSDYLRGPIDDSRPSDWEA